MNQKKPEPKTNQAEPRTCAVRAMQWIFAKHQPVDYFWDKDSIFLNLSDRDRALVRAIVGTSLRHLGQIDMIINQVVARPLPKKAVAARQILRTGLAELLFMRSASHGVVNSLVQLAGRWRESRHYKGLINAVLRRMTREGEYMLAQIPLTLNIPDWPGEHWDDVYGAKTRARAAQVMARPAPLDITLLGTSKNTIAELGGSLLSQDTLRLQQKGRIEELPGFADGTWIVQDVSAALPAQILAAKPNENILDLCAAPGGKTMQMAFAGANITALDASAARLQRLTENLTRTKLKADLICADAALWRSQQKFDAVLLDAPCSATGIFRHHPDVLYNCRAKDLSELAHKQLMLAQNAASLLKAGGRMVYCVCSAEPQEGEDIVQSLLQSSDLELEKISKTEAGIADGYLANGMVRIVPGAYSEQGGMDAFFVAKFCKPG